MSVKMRVSSGSYNVRASEMARDRPITKTVRCNVHFLDETEAAFEIDKRAKAQTLLDKVFDHLELIERDYFGLQFVDVAPAPDGLRWLDPIKTIKKQMGMRPPYYLYFRVKFYVCDPSKLSDEYTRYHFFLQLKRDIVEGKLVVPYKSAVVLASYSVQSELGDYSTEEHTSGYLSELRFIPSQTEDFEREVSDFHRQHRGLNPSECEVLFLEEVHELDQYGVDIHNAFWDQSNLEIQLGVTSVGLVVFQNNVRINTFSWAKIVKISFKRKQFFIQLRREVVSGQLPSTTNDNIDNLIGFNMVSYRSCKNLWKSCVEHHTFFRLHMPPPNKGGFLNIGSKFRYRSPSKRYARRTIGATSRDAIQGEQKVSDGYRSPPHSQSMDNFRIHQDGYSSSNSNSPTKSNVNIPNSTSYPNSIRTAYRGNSDNNNQFQHTNHARKTLPSDYKPNEYPSLKRSSVRTPTRNVNSQNNTNTSSPSSSLMEPDRTPRSLEIKPEYRLSRSVDNRSDNRSDQRSDSRSSQLYERPLDDRNVRPVAPSAYHQPERINGQNGSDTTGHYSNSGSLRSNASTIRGGGGFSDKSSLRSNTSSQVTTSTVQKDVPPAIPAKMPGYMDEGKSTNQVPTYSDKPTNHAPTYSDKPANHVPTYSDKPTSHAPTYSDKPTSHAPMYSDKPANHVPTYSDKLPNGSVFQDNPGLVTIRMKPDSLGRFGFNVKGGADQGMPIIVSRVAPSTSADQCMPRLNEGDQVLFINGRDVSQHTHEQVVMFIKASRETHSGELVLIVRPNAVYIGEDTPDEPDFQYIPDTHHITSTLPPGGDPLAGSLMLLQESLESGAAVAQFEQMYRKKPGMTMNASKLSDNITKNRYRDISPYDQTRVKIKLQSGDYINANHVNMEIQGSGIVNSYVAAQGPLPNTSHDFWAMIWEQHCTLIVMLTTNIERGRVKCHQYWPELYEMSEFGPMHVTCLKEEKTASFAFRDFTLINKETAKGEERHIRQMQYIAWPDHGVPDDSSDFLDFVLRVRQNRVGMVEPTIVHCSAGIGRTGVLITMETAMCLIEANQPVYPLDMVRQMRDQRAMLIQTSSQYKFVCEAISRVYSDKIVEPLEDFRR